MKLRFPIGAQILAFLILNLLIIRVLFLLLFNSQFGWGWEPLLDSPVGERFNAIAWVIHRQTQALPPEAWNNVLEEFGKVYGVNFYVFTSVGNQVAGQPVILPEPVLRQVRAVRRFAGAPALPPDSNILHPLHFRLGRLHGRFLLHTGNPDCFWIGTRFPLRNRADGPGILLAASTNLWQSRLFLDFGIFLAAFVGIFCLSALIWWPFVYRLTSSLRELTHVTERIAEGRFDVSLKANRWDEMGRLSEAINAMSFRLNAFVSGQKRFLGDISHELCAPISRLRVALELMQHAGTKDQEGIIRDIQEEVDEMASLINELLAFSEAGLKGKETELLPVDLEILLGEVVQRTCSGNQVNLTVSKGLRALGDRLLLERAFSNILRNSVRYTNADAPIVIKASPAGDAAIVTITDSGPGIPKEALKLVGQPFYRPEWSRSRSSGGVGLGLAIVKSCVEACNGSVTFQHAEPCGLEVTIQLRSCLASLPVAAPERGDSS